MTPAVYLGAAAVVVATIAGFAAGQHWTQAAWDREKLAASRAQTEYLSRNFVSRVVADAANAAIRARLDAALQKARHEPIQPLPCPPGVDVRAVVLPGLADRLRAIRAAGGHGAGPDVAPVGSAGPAGADDGGAVRDSAD